MKFVEKLNLFKISLQNIPLVILNQPFSYFFPLQSHIMIKTLPIHY